MIETILDPTDEQVPLRGALAVRPATVAGTIGLLDISKPRGNIFLARVADLIAKRFPHVELRKYRKPTFAKPAPSELRRGIASECGVVIEALGD